MVNIPLLNTFFASSKVLFSASSKLSNGIPITSRLTSISNSPINMKKSEMPDYAIDDAYEDDTYEYAKKEEQVEITVLSNVTNASNFDDGLKKDASTVLDFQKIVKGRDPKEIFSFIAKRSNPYQFMGAIKNMLHYFSSGALNQNCIICSKAVEKNLALLENEQIDCFWVAESIQPGVLAGNVSPAGLTQFTLKTNQPLSEQLLAASNEGNRYIISVPVKNKSFAHAMNLVRTGSGDIVIDGQWGLTYNLSLPHERKIFDSHYGENRNDVMRPVQIYLTGNAPSLVSPNQDINIEEWEIINWTSLRTVDNSGL